MRTLNFPMLCLALAVASSSMAPAKQSDQHAMAAQELAKALEGRTAGPAVNCIPNFQGKSRMEVIDDGTILFREGGTVYVQKPRQRCDRIKDGGYVLVTRQYGNQQFCSGDINQLIDANTGVFGGDCVFGPFVPYRKGS